MAFPKKPVAAAVLEEDTAYDDVDTAMEAAEHAKAAVEAAPADEAIQVVEEPVKEEAVITETEVAVEQPEVAAEKVDDLNSALLGVDMSLPEEDAGLTNDPASKTDATPSSTAAPVSGTDETKPTADENAGATPSVPTPRLVGDGDHLSPEAKRERAMRERQNAMRGGGGGGGGGIVAAASGAVGSLIRGAGAAVKAAGGQRLADKYLNPDDPLSVAEGLGRTRYSEFNKALKTMGIASRRRENAVNQLNDYIARSPSGQRLSELAHDENKNLPDFMNEIMSGKNSSPEARDLVAKLERDPNVFKMAADMRHSSEVFDKAQMQAVKNFDKLQETHASKINVKVESDRLLDAVEAASESKATPLPLKAKSGDGAEEIDTKENQKKFMEALEKIKETIAAILQKIASKLGLGGPK
jgi:hypothetical protein